MRITLTVTDEVDSEGFVRCEVKADGEGLEYEFDGNIGVVPSVLVQTLADAKDNGIGIDIVADDTILA